jgi:hypothetical protein
VARILDHSAGAALLAELEVLVGRRDEVRHLQDHWRWYRRDVSLAGPRPVRVLLDRGGEQVVLLGSALAVQDPGGRSHTFVVVPLAAFEGERIRLGDPLVLLPGAPSVYALASLLCDDEARLDPSGRKPEFATRAGAVSRRWNVALLRVDEAMAQACDLNALTLGDDAMPSPAMSWVRTPDDDAVWCHVTSEGRPTRADNGAREVVPVLPSGDVKWLPKAPRERLLFNGTRVRGWLCGSHFIPARELAQLASEAVIRGMTWPARLREILSALFPPAVSRLPLLRPGERMLDWLSTEHENFSTVLRAELLLGIVVLSGLGIAWFVGAAHVLAWAAPPGYQAVDFWEQVRMGVGVLVTLALGVPLLFRVRAAVPAVWIAAAAGFAALVTCSRLGVEYTAPIAAATTGSLFGLAARTLRGEKPQQQPAAGRFETAAILRSALTISGAGLVVLVGYAITQWHPFRNQALPIGVALTLLVFLTAHHQTLVRHATGARFEFREWTWRVITTVLGMSGLIWLGIALANDRAASHLLEGLLFGALASLLLLALTPLHRRASSTALELSWGVFLTMLALVLHVVAQHRPEVYPVRLTGAFIAFVGSFLATRVITGASMRHEAN